MARKSRVPFGALTQKPLVKILPHIVGKISQ
jgi:hypothetical protein